MRNGHFGNGCFETCERRNMKFYDRLEELDYLHNVYRQSADNARFTVVTGRRRIGKTSLLLKAYEDEPMLYFFVARKSESDLCESYLDEIKRVFDVSMLGKCDRFIDIFEWLMEFSEKQHFTLVIDEFQEFFRVNQSVFSDMQRIWDKYEKTSHINLIVCGSVYSMMSKIFKDKKEPLYGRGTGELRVKPFRPSVLKQILADANPDFANEDLLALFSFTGGVAKYVQLLVDAKALTKEAMIDYIISPNSPMLNEGKNSLIEEFGRDYGIYFSILSCVARGCSTRTEIENVVGREIGGYLTNLEHEYELLKKRQPMFEKSSSKNVRYELDDAFYCFWFRFVFKYSYIIEIENYQKLKEIIMRDYDTFSGLMLERYFYAKAVESGQFTRIGRWWDRKGHNEIDMIAADELDNKVTFYEIKKDYNELRTEHLKSKTESFLNATHAFKDYSVETQGLSVKDM